MTTLEALRIGMEMRLEQKRYFAARRKGDDVSAASHLERSKVLEKQFDEAAAAALNKQKELF